LAAERRLLRAPSGRSRANPKKPQALLSRLYLGGS